MNLFAAALLLAPASAPGIWNEHAVLPGAGASVAIDGDTAVVAGLKGAFVFVRNGTAWSQQAALSAGCTVAEFVAIDGDTVVYSGPDGCSPLGPGLAAVFSRSGTTWSLDDVIHAPQGASALFGQTDVTIEGDQILVGDEGIGAHVFVRRTNIWRSKALLKNAGYGLGSSVDLDGNTAVVGALGSLMGGSAHVFRGAGETWSLEAVLEGNGGAAGPSFGADVHLAGDTLVVGAFGANDNGAAYVFQRVGTSWTQEAELSAGDGDDGDWFGASVATDGDLALIGAPYHDQPLKKAGAAYVFARSGTSWAEVAKLASSNPTLAGKLGNSVGLSGGTALVGAEGANESYVYMSGGFVTYCTAGVSASGCQATIAASGTPSATAPSGFQFSAANVEGGKNGFFYFGTNGRQAVPWGNGTGFQCVVPPVLRAGVLLGSGTTGLCDGSFSQDMNALWCPTCPKPQKNPGAGATVQAQLWYRDPQNTSNQTTSLSDAIELVIGP
jgi:hypothetical protein